jgi:exopolysaccharide biosynthesis predicted pyruvyltransferase EpsI
MAKAGLIVALNGREAATLTASIVSRLKLSYGNTVFLSMVQGSGIADSEGMPVGISQGFSSVTSGLRWENALWMIGRSDAVVASRMHALYMCAISDTPCVAVGSAAKMNSFVQEFMVNHAEDIHQLPVEARKADLAKLNDAAARVSVALDDALAALVGSTVRDPNLPNLNDH